MSLTCAWLGSSTPARKASCKPVPSSSAITLYAYTPTQKVIAIDAASGKLLWKFDSGILGTAPACGLWYWTNGKQSCIFAGVINFLYALDPARIPHTK
jgi:outer membrane protein assembly factor BamB